MRPSALVSSVALAFASVSHADIFQYADCDGDGSLLLTELDAEPGVNLSGLYLGCAALNDANMAGADFSGADIQFGGMRNGNFSSANFTDCNMLGSFIDDSSFENAILDNAQFSLGTRTNFKNATMLGAVIDLSDDVFSSTVFEGADLAGSSLIGPSDSQPTYFFRPNFQNANMTDCGIKNVQFEGESGGIADFRGANFTSGSVENCMLIRLDLTAANLSDLVSVNSSWITCSLKGANLQNAELADAFFSGITSGDIQGIPSSLPEFWVIASGYLVGPFADVSNSNLSSQNFEGQNFTGANFEFAIVEGSNFTNATLRNVNLSSAYVCGTDFSYVDFSSAQLVSVDFCDAVLLETNFQNANLIGSSFASQDLSGLNFASADLSYSDLRFADLSNANLSGADLTGANIYQANLYGVDLSGTNLEGVDLSVAVFIPPVTGSCCIPTGCTIISNRQCTEIGGTWTEDGSCDDCSPAPEPCAADLSGDGIVGFDDLVNVISNWGVCP